MAPPLTVNEYRELLRSAIPGVVDADTRDPDLRTLFTPDGHRLALEPDVSIVRGGRGAGKTVWFKVLQNQVLRQVAAEAYQLARLTRIEAYAGYGSALAPTRYPGPAVLEKLEQQAGSPLEIWMAILVTALDDGIAPHMSRWTERLDWVRDNPEGCEQILDNADRRAEDEGVTILLLFDALDRMHVDRVVTDRLVGGLLRLALDLRTRTRNIRAKIFIRHDMLDSGMLHFPDASKLRSNERNLTWTDSNLYGLLFHQLGNADTALADRFRARHGDWKADSGAEDGAPLRYQAPSALTGDRSIQQKVFVEIAGRYMGTDHRKGHTYTWLPNHLMDGLNQVSPRSFLRALVEAVEISQAQHAGYPYPLHFEGIRRGVQQASRVRVDEVVEDLPWVAKAVSALAGLQVPIEPDVVIDRWKRRRLSETLAEDASRKDPTRDETAVRTGPRNPTNYRELIRELVEIGVMKERANGRLDLPDVYRIAFNIGRKGGVPRLKTSS